MQIRALALLSFLLWIGLLFAPLEINVLSSYAINTNILGMEIILTFPILAGALSGFFGAFVTDYIFKKFYGRFASIELRIRGTKPSESIKTFFIFSFKELIALLFVGIMTGILFAYANHSLFLINGLAIFVFVSLVTNIVHITAHIFTARKYKTISEFKFWDVGFLVLIITTILFNTPFGYAGRIYIMSDPKDPKGFIRDGVISLAGPLAALILAIGFLLLGMVGGIFSLFGAYGLGVSIVSCVNSLMPYAKEGKKVYKWNKYVWGSVFIPAMLLYIAYLLSIKNVI